MSFNMMHTNQRDTGRIADGFCFCYANQQSTYQTRTVGHTNSIHLLQFHARFRKCFTNHIVNLLNMFP